MTIRVSWKESVPDTLEGEGPEGGGWPNDTTSGELGGRSVVERSGEHNQWAELVAGVTSARLGKDEAAVVVAAGGRR
jgi:hypothetical protein